ncbi:hypothetical protein KAF25_003530 [Fusarium avenaceum]|uniref:Uncharacterized protein n=1 Tax=Fusarium avenaceum TaxID=40199 RepID=A0A9P7H1B9_9HYPO|nr:hypothetical protein KAF25_003530 [Fusarium avenaceum]
MAIVERNPLVDSGLGFCKSCACTSFGNINGGMDPAVACACGHKHGNHVEL